MMFFKKLIGFVIPIATILTIIFFILLNSPTLAESILHLNEYDQVALINKLIAYLPIIWFALLFISLSLIFGVSFKTKKKRVLWFVPLPFILIFLMGTTTSTLPLDTFLLKNGASLEKEMLKLQKKPTLKSEELKLYEMSIHFKNPALQTGSYMVTRLKNPTTNLQDEYWYFPLNPINKWKKDKNPIINREYEPIGVKDINWQVVPDIIKETKEKLQRKDIYYPGINMVLLFPINDEWQWRVSVIDIRGTSIGNMIYDLDGKLIEDEIP